MKHSSLRFPLVFALLLIGACQASTTSLRSVQKPIPASLADRLPADTIAYVSLPDIQAMRTSMQNSMLVKLYEEPDVQNFVSGLVNLLDQSWDELRSQAAAEGVPVELTHWEALRSFEMGIALRANPAANATFDLPPHVFAVARLGLAEGLGQRVFDLLATQMGEHAAIVSGPGESSMQIVDEMEEGVPLRGYLKCTSNAVEIEFLMGERGEGALSATENFRRAWNRNYTNGAAVFGFLRIDGILRTILMGAESEQPDIVALVKPFFDQLIAPIQSVSFASGWSKEGSFLNGMLDLSENPGPAWQTVAADKQLAEYIPEGATAFSLAGANLDPGIQALLDMVDRVAAFQPEGLPMPLGQMMQMEAPELHAWILGAHRAEMQSALLGLGQRSFSYSVPTGSMGSESLSFFELDDAAALSSLMEQLLPRLRVALNDSESPVKLEMRRAKRKVTQADGSVTEVAGPAYYWMDFELPPQAAQIMGMLNVKFEPAMGIAPEGWLVMSLSRESVANVLREGMRKPDASILENKDAASFLAKLPKGASSAAWSDPRPAAAAALGMIGGMLPMVASMAGELPIPVNLNAFPAPDVFIRNMRTSESWSWVQHGERMSRSVGSMNLADLFTVVAAAVAITPPMIGIVMPMLQGMDDSASEPEDSEGGVEF